MMFPVSQEVYFWLMVLHKLPKNARRHDGL